MTETPTPVNMAKAVKSLGKIPTSCDVDVDVDEDEDEDEDEMSESSSVSGGSDEEESCSSSTRNRSPNPPKLDPTGPLYELSSSLMEHLPIKKGLSKYYEGKSQSFTSLSDAKSVEDLPKKETPFKRRIKPSKSYAGGLDETRRNYPVQDPNSRIITTKSPSSGSCANSVARSSHSKNFAPRPPPIHVNKNLPRR